ncbi:MAG: tRNA dihydrouridine synthase DusB [Clostridia bacterium]|nr:tRNA dihydrouridine synthase DusB [Clostridia bacterium]
MFIGKTEFKYGLFLAPMAGITDHAFRRICKTHGAECAVTELVSAKAIVFGDKKSFDLARVCPDESPCAIQLFGSEPKIIAQAAKEVTKKFSPAFIDINMGCPMPKLVGNGEGCALMRRPALCEKIIYEVANAVDIPVTAKMRRECEDGDENAPEVAKACERGGASAVFIHGRTRKQLYSGKADLDTIRRVKEAVTIPVIGNGDVRDPESYDKMLSTGCDGVMIGRGAYGSPWVFAQITAHIENRVFSFPTDAEKREILISQLETVISEKGERGIIEFRHHLLQYCKGFKGSAALRAGIANVKKREDAINAINAVFAN